MPAWIAQLYPSPAEMTAAGKGELFEQLKAHLTAGADEPSHADTAAELKISQGAVKVRVHRMRQRYRRVLRGQIAMTLGDPNDVDDEIRGLFAALGR